MKIEKPSLLFSLEKCRSNCEYFSKSVRDAFPSVLTNIYYAIKAHPSDTVCGLVASQNIGAEVITESEIQTVAKYGMKMVVNGHYKSDNFLRMAIEARADSVNIESVEELLRIERMAEYMNVAHVPVGIRVKLDANRKLGLSVEDFCLLKTISFRRCMIQCVHFHAGWNVKDDSEITKCLHKLLEANTVLLSLGYPIKTINFGGSFCEFSADPEQLQRRLNLYKTNLPKNITCVHFEPGRALVGDCGVLKSEIVGVQPQGYTINTCAYGYRLTGATPDIEIISMHQRQTSAPVSIVLLGFWPSENDQIMVDGINVIPNVGDTVLMRNFGAYVMGWERQFESNEGISYAYIPSIPNF